MPNPRTFFQSFILIILVATLNTGCAWFKKDEPEDLNLTAEEMYGQAKEQLLEGNWSSAIDALQKLEARYPYGRYAKQAQLDTVFAHYKADNQGLAIAAAERFISLNPTHESVDYALYLKGMASFNERHDILGVVTGRTNLSERDPEAINNAIESFEALLTRFPESRYARDARTRTRYLRSALASREIRIAQYYYSRQAYLAVVNRCKYVLENHTHAKEAEDALGLMMHSYRQMGLNDLAGDTQRILETNYPGSAYLSDMDSKGPGFFARLIDKI